MRILVFFLLVGLSFCGELKACFLKASLKYGVPLELLLAIAKTESNFNPYAINRNRNGSKDIGIMQINTANVPLLIREGIIKNKNELFNPCKNIEAGAYILKRCLDTYGLNWRGVDCYNKGRKAKGRGGYVWKVYKNLREMLD